MIPIAISGTLLEESEKPEALAALRAAKLPTPALPLTVGEGCSLISVSVSHNAIVGEPSSDPSCTPPPYLCAGGTCGETILYSPLDTIRSVLPYPKRTDTLLVAFGKNIYALEIDPLNPRTFIPVLSGTSPSFARLKDDSIVVSDGSSVFRLSL